MARTELISPHAHSERILVTGGGGAGKSRGLMTIAELLPRAMFYVVEQERSPSYEVSLPKFPGVASHMEVVEMFGDFEEYRDTVIEIIETNNLSALGKAKTPPHERPWLVLDTVTTSWGDCRNWWLLKTFGDGIFDRLAEIDLDRKLDYSAKAKARDEIVNYRLIGPEYDKVLDAIGKWRGNLYLTTQAGNTNDKEKKPEIVALYGPWGLKPKGNPGLHHYCNTNLLMQCKGKDRWEMTTFKDREREMLEHAPLDNFALDYLVAVGGWERKIVRASAA